MKIEDRVGIIEWAFDMLEAEVARIISSIEGLRARATDERLTIRGGTVEEIERGLMEEVGRGAARFREMIGGARRGATPGEYTEHHARKRRDMR